MKKGCCLSDTPSQSVELAYPVATCDTKITYLETGNGRLFTHLDDVLGHVDLVRAEQVQHIHASVLARERQHRDIEVNSQLRAKQKNNKSG